MKVEIIQIKRETKRKIGNRQAHRGIQTDRRKCT